MASYLLPLFFGRRLSSERDSNGGLLRAATRFLKNRFAAKRPVVDKVRAIARYKSSAQHLYQELAGKEQRSSAYGDHWRETREVLARFEHHTVGGQHYDNDRYLRCQ